MELLSESKRKWLLYYVICTIIPSVLYYFFWDNPIVRTVVIMFIGIQAIIFVFFWLVLIFKWKAHCRMIVTLIYLGFTIYEGINGNLVKWYIIIPTFLFTEVYMLWNLGGVVNCIIASPHRNTLNSKISAGIVLYNKYSGGLDVYNENNGLGFFKKVRKKKAPDWKKLGFNYTALDMFQFDIAINGIDVLQFEIKEQKLDEIINDIDDKNDVIAGNSRIHDDKVRIDKIYEEAKSMGVDLSECGEIGKDIEIINGKNIKAGKPILKRKLRG